MRNTQYTIYCYNNKHCVNLSNSYSMNTISSFLYLSVYAIVIVALFNSKYYIFYLVISPLETLWSKVNSTYALLLNFPRTEYYLFFCASQIFHILRLIATSFVCRQVRETDKMPLPHLLSRLNTHQQAVICKCVTYVKSWWYTNIKFSMVFQTNGFFSLEKNIRIGVL